MSFLTLLGNKYVWIILILLGITSGVWFKITSLERAVEKSQQALAVQVEANKALESNNATLHQNLDLALSVNEANAKIVERVKSDQDHAATALQRLATDLSASKATLNQARAQLAATASQPAVPVPPRIVETIITIQDSRVTQAALNKQAEDALK